MDRPITGFELDAAGDWAARLSCGHAQHVRHNPPFENRPWVRDEEARNAKLGVLLNCLRCDRFELPENYVPYQRTPVFTEQSVPAGLQKDHATRAGVWAQIVVLEGALKYCVDGLGLEFTLAPDQPGTVLPEVLHHVEPLGGVQFYVEFYHTPDRAAEQT